MDIESMGVPLESVAHIIQVALTPVFLLSGIAAMLNVITARLGRVADQADAVLTLFDHVAGEERDRLITRLSRLRNRIRALDVARASCALAGAATCGATFALFLGALQNAGVATALFLLFGAAVFGTTAAMIAFFAEIVLSWHGYGTPALRADIAHAVGDRGATDTARPGLSRRA